MTSSKKVPIGCLVVSLHQVLGRQSLRTHSLIPFPPNQPHVRYDNDTGGLSGRESNKNFSAEKKIGSMVQLLLPVPFYISKVIR